MAPDDNPGVPLGHYRTHGAGVRVYCWGCYASVDYPLEAVIGRLEARGVGGAHTGIKAVAALIRQPCKRCGGTRFDTSPAFQPGPR
jgi:hypothetical protein